MPSLLAADDGTKRALLIRAAAAGLVVVAYFLARGSLPPQGVIAARFGLGVSLFALLVDAGRRLVGEGPPVTGSFVPHQQSADPLVDERYERVHEAVKRFVDEGVWTSSYERLVEEVFDANGVREDEQRAALAKARKAAAPQGVGGEPLWGSLLAGGIVVVGCTGLVGVMLESVGLPIFGPVVLVGGMGVGLLQLRAHDLGARWAGLALGLVGSAFVGVGALQMGTRYAGPWWLVVGLAVVLLGATVLLAAKAKRLVSTWERLEARLVKRLDRLRGAFLVLLVVGGVLFPFRPSLEEMFVALGWPFDVPYRLVTIGYVTLLGYVGVEALASWYGLARGRREARNQRARRVRANEALLGLLEEEA